MRVILDAAVMERPASGIAKVTLGLYRACLELEPDLHVTALHKQPLACDLPAGVASMRVGQCWPDRGWRRLGLAFAICRQPADIVHFPCNGGIPWLPCRRPMVTTIHDVLPLIIPGYFKSDQDELRYRRRLQWDIDRVDLVVTDSHFSSNEIISNFTLTTEPVVIYPGPTLARELIGCGSPVPSESYFVYLGGYDPRKGLENLVNVFLGLRHAQRLSSKLVLTGEPKYFSETLKTATQEGRRLGQIEERGYVPDEELVLLLSQAKALVYPSLYEGFGLPPLEAMTVGCPVITSKATSIPEVCGEAAHYIDADDSMSIAQALMMLETNNELRLDLIGKGRAQAQKFSWAASAEKYLQCVEKICRKP